MTKLDGGVGETERLNPWQVAWRIGIEAAKRNRVPGFLLWLFGSLIVAGYYTVPPVHDLLQQVGRLKTEWGWWFSMVSTAIFGGLLPTLIPIWLVRGGTPFSWSLLLSNLGFWSLKGLEIDALYRAQALMFGEQITVSTLVVKTAFDQLVYAPLLGLTNVMLFYMWRDSGYSFRRFFRRLRPDWFRFRLLPALISNWAVWCPAVVLIYCLPLPLQLPIQNLVLCFWVLILVFFTAPPSGEEMEQPPIVSNSPAVNSVGADHSTA